MSLSLVRKGLELFRDDLHDEASATIVSAKDVQGKKASATRVKPKKAGGSVKTERRVSNRKTRDQHRDSCATEQKSQVGSTSIVDGNVERFLQLDSAMKASSVMSAEQVMEYNARKRTQISDEAKKKVNKSIFSDKDFDEFEKEYVDW